MKKLTRFGAAVLALAAPASALAQDPHGGRRHGDRGHGRAEQEEREGPRLGEKVEDFALADNSGAPFRLGALRRTGEDEGTIAVLTFWCTTCMSCRRIDRAFHEKAGEYEGKGVRFLMVDSNVTDDAEGVNRFLEENDLSFRVLMDRGSEVARYFGATLTTTTAVIDAEGRLRYYGGFGKAEDAVRNLLAGEEVAVPESRGFG